MENILLCLVALVCLWIFWKVTKILIKIFFLLTFIGIVYFYFFNGQIGIC